jgi:hypothetical protein
LRRYFKLGGGPGENRKNSQTIGKLTAQRKDRACYLDKDTFSQEIGLLVAYDEYNGQVPCWRTVCDRGWQGVMDVI